MKTPNFYCCIYSDRIEQPQDACKEQCFHCGILVSKRRGKTKLLIAKHLCGGCGKLVDYDEVTVVSIVEGKQVQTPYHSDCAKNRIS